MTSTHLISTRGAPRLALTLLGFCLGACSQPPNPSPTTQAATAPPRPADPCPQEAPRRGPLPGVRPAHSQLAQWEAWLGARLDLDAPLLSPAEIRDLNAAIEARRGEEKLGRIDLRQPIDAEGLKADIDDRLTWLNERFTSGVYAEADGRAIAPMPPPPGLPPLRPQVHRALAQIQVRCAPRVAGFYKRPALDPDFDRNQCSSVRAQGFIQVLADWPGGVKLARAEYTLGWIAADAPLSPPLSAEDLAQLEAPRAYMRATTTLTLDGAPITLPKGATLPLVEGALWVATASGIKRAEPPAEASPTPRPLTRRALLREAFSWLDTPYGWGDQGGGSDCSRYLMDIFDAFGVRLPRFSGHQARAGTFSIDLSPLKSERERGLLLDAAAARGIVLIHFPGHIALYLGRDDQGQPMAIHSFSEYVEPCPEGIKTDNPKRETLRRVDAVKVTDLELGRGSSRGAFIERITRLTVFGGAPGVALNGAAELRAPAPLTATTCAHDARVPIFTSPRQPNAEQPLRLLIPTNEELGPVGLTVETPKGRLTPPLKRLGGPPYTYVATIEAPAPGDWRVYIGEGERARSCRRLTVKPKRPKVEGRESGATWEAKVTWGPQMEDLYAGFVEALFDYPLEDERTWTNLHSLLEDRARNLLYDHLSLDEDSRLRLEPDCADLPYFLRAYFAWKMGLPYGFRQCSRSRDGRPARCDAPQTQLTPRSNRDDVKAFSRFVRRVKGAVHSSSARTRPQDEESDLYPVPISRYGLRPGSTYADPYGHTLILIRWVPQGVVDYGVLLAADAQPDGTIGRRRFWRGSFLFTSETDSVGAGFKAFRPVLTRGGEVQIRDNAYLSKSKTLIPYSEQQYESDDAFYDGVEALINPRPLDPFRRQASLVDALHEVVKRRVLAVNNGEDYMRQHGGVVELPKGANIFLTTGPWEDFATPSRDMRLLISIDAVLRFEAQFKRAPSRFGIDEAAVEATMAQLRATLPTQLAARHIEYTRTDGVTQRLSLQDVVDRRRALEMAYNLNDCVEIRWGAAEGSEEIASCRRRAPAKQRAQMEVYRRWFESRKRPAR
ncbi:C40 family peptidase [Myxococcota bacterium]|nr:C40 family peptidase [Myxococcota bacterium]